MKTMQDFRDSLFVEAETTTPLQKDLAALTNFSRIQLNSLAQFEPWYIWQADNSLA